MRLEHQIAVLYCGTHGLLTEVPLDQVTRFEKEFLNALEANHREDVLDTLQKGEMNDQIGEIIEKVARDTIFTMKR